jgi:predicted nuclease of restriction endonuclease-like (RecB) superfamily
MVDLMRRFYSHASAIYKNVDSCSFRSTLLELTPVTDLIFSTPEKYDEFLQDVKQHIRQAQVKAALAVNQELIMLYWQIGTEISLKIKREGWGAKVTSRLAKDLKKAFPEMTGLSERNLQYMRTFADAYPDLKFTQRIAAQIPWRQNQAILEKVKSPEERIWYAQKSFENGWSRDVLVLQIETNLYMRSGGAATNFERTLPKPQSDLAQELLKNPYCFEFLTIAEDAQERDLELNLLGHIKEFLLELGIGFAFLGSQYPMVVDGREYRIDLLFYHVKLRCYIVIDLKMGEFTPAHSGQLNFYVSAVDNLLRSEWDNRTIGMILCRSKSDTTVQYALQDIQKPIGVSTYRLKEDLPESVKSSLPTLEQLQMELDAAVAEVQANTAAEDANEE